MEFRFADCSANLEADILTIQNSRIRRKWRLTPHGLQAISLANPLSGKEWLADSSDLPGTCAPAPLSLDVSSATLSAMEQKPSVVSAQALCAKLTVNSAKGEVALLAVIFPDTAAITLQLFFPQSEQVANASITEDGPTGVEEDPVAQTSGLCNADIQEYLRLSNRHLTLSNYELQDQTDQNDNLFHLQQWRANKRQPINLKGCLFSAEDVFDRESVILLKHAPLPLRRNVDCEFDLLNRNSDFALCGHCSGSEPCGYRWSVLLATGGSTGVTASLQHLQQQQRVYKPGLDGLALANTWGDRNRDACVNEAFMLKEIDIAAKLGIDVCQIDDGWQQGISSNSSEADTKGGVWEGFYAADPDFWQPHPTRFPNGLQPIVDKATQTGVGLGLWFAPDSSNDFANNNRDIENIARMHKEWGVRWIKIDGVKARTKTGETRLLEMFYGSLDNCNGDLLFDQDITAEIRPGYWPLPETGPLFVENRYSDWGCWWPHATLRNIWQLSHVINPSRLRMEILNIERNLDKYGDDPLAPKTYDPAFIFATIMVTSPLFWCELSSLPEKTVQSLMPIIKLWKEHREFLHTSTCYPIGECPNGASICGFACEKGDEVQLLFFRQLSSDDSARIALPTDYSGYTMETVYGNGEFTLNSQEITVSIPQQNSVLWLKGKK